MILYTAHVNTKSTMGSPVSVTVADLVMKNVEERALPPAPTSHSFEKGTGMTLSVLPPDQTQAFLHHYNSIKPPIQFTIEKESRGTILFLDTMVTRHDNGSLSHHRVLQEDSHRPLSGFFIPPHSCTQGYSYTHRAHQTRSAVSSKTKMWTRSILIYTNRVQWLMMQC